MQTLRSHFTLATLKIAFFTISLIIAAIAFFVGLFAIVNHRDTLLQIIFFSVTFGSFIFSIITAFPQVVPPVQVFWRALLYTIMVLIVLTASCLIPLVTLAFQEPIIKIGVSLPFSSEDEPDATPIFNAIQLAMRNVTDNGKLGNYTIRLVPFDDRDVENNKVQRVDDNGKSINNIGIEDFTNITNDAQIAAIIGPFNSGKAIYEIPPTTKASIALFSPATTADCLTMLNNVKNDVACQFKDLDKNKETTFFRMPAPDSMRAEVLVNYFWKEKIGLRQREAGKDAVIFNDRSVFGRNFANQLREVWKKKMQKDAIVVDLTNPQADLKKLKTKPDVILYAGTGSGSIQLYNAMKDTGYADTAFAASATIMRGGLADASARGDIYAASPYNFEHSEEYNKFFASYKTKYRNEPTPYSASAYDTTRILLKSIEKAMQFHNPPVATLDILSQAGPFRTTIINNLRRVNNGGIDYTGITGTYHFEHGDAKKSAHDQYITIFKYTGKENLWEPVS